LVKRAAWVLAAATGLYLLGGLADRPFAAEPRAEVRGVQDRALRDAIVRAIGQSQRAPQSRLEARRRAQEAADQAVAVLRSEGYYAYSVDAALAEGAAAKPVVEIEPGPRFLIANPSLEFVGAPPIPLAEGDARAALGLKPGAPGQASDVLAAEGRIVAALQRDGYPDAEAAPREVVVDHTALTVQPTFRIDAHVLVLLDGVKVTTTGRTRAGWVVKLAPWKSGDVYTPQAVAELERRLLDTGVYDSVTVALADTPDADGRRPVSVSLSDRAKANIALGASYSTTEGAGVTGRYSLYNRLGRSDTITFSAQYANILKRVDVQVSLPHWRAPRRTLRLGATGYIDDTSAYHENDEGVRADIEQRFGSNSLFTYGLALDYSRNTEKTLVAGQIVGVQRNLALATGLARLSLDRSDSILDPKRGWRLDGRVEPTFGAGDDTLLYGKVQAQASAYLPLGEAARTVLAGRLKLGTVVSGGGTPNLPASRRFYAGGGGSVRGYAYQAVGPRFPDGTPIGGQSLAEASFELRQKLNRRIGLVGFIDAGTVSAEKYPDFKSFSAGAGVGVRYDLGFGPLSLDLATPLNRRTGDGVIQVYLSIGQAF